MTKHRESIGAWIEERAEAIIAAPPMWGNAEAVEMQLLQLIQIHEFVASPERSRRDPRRLLDEYHRFLRTRFPKEAGPASSFGDASEVAEVFSDFWKSVRPTLGTAAAVDTQSGAKAGAIQRLVVKPSPRSLQRLSLAAVGKVTALWSALLSSFEHKGRDLGDIFAVGAATGSVVIDLGCSSPKLAPMAAQAVVEAIALSSSARMLPASLRKLSIDAFRLAALLESIADGEIDFLVETIGTDQKVAISSKAAGVAARSLRVVLALTLDTSEIPQADVLSRLFRLVKALLAGDPVSEETTGIVGRQINYYKHAARTLGYLDESNAATSIGEHLVDSSPSSRLALTATQFENSRCGTAWLKWSKVPSLPFLKASSAYDFLRDVTLLSESTADRRAQTLVAWLGELKEHHYSQIRPAKG